MARATRTALCTPAQATSRASIARAYLDAAELILSEKVPTRTEFSSVAAGLAVLAGIAASDAICGHRLQKIHRGQDHRDAADLLTTAVPDGKSLARTLARLLDVKDAAHYGVEFLAGRRAGDTVRWARTLVERAQEEVER